MLPWNLLPVRCNWSHKQCKQQSASSEMIKQRPFVSFSWQFWQWHHKSLSSVCCCWWHCYCCFCYCRCCCYCPEIWEHLSRRISTSIKWIHSAKGTEHTQTTDYINTPRFYNNIQWQLHWSRTRTWASISSSTSSAVAWKPVLLWATISNALPRSSGDNLVSAAPSFLFSSVEVFLKQHFRFSLVIRKNAVNFQAEKCSWKFLWGNKICFATENLQSYQLKSINEEDREGVIHWFLSSLHKCLHFLGMMA